MAFTFREPPEREIERRDRNDHTSYDSDQQHSYSVGHQSQHANQQQEPGQFKGQPTMLAETQKFLRDFNPETSTRERRKLTRANIYKASYTNALHDREGCLIENGTDFCDCLEPDCPGCHFPCPKCSSAKCSVDCRKNRKWTPDIINLEGTSIVVEAPKPSNPQSYS